MSDEKRGPRHRLEGERRGVHDETSASLHDADSGHVEVFSRAAQEKARDSGSPSQSPQLPTHVKAHDLKKSQPPPQGEAQRLAEKPSIDPRPPTHEEAHDSLERPSSSPQSPMHEEVHSSEKSSQSSKPLTRDQEQHTSVKQSPTAKQKALRARAISRRDEGERMKQERRRLENERRLEGQRLENERMLEERRKAAAEAAAARAQNEGEERSTNGGELSQRLSGGQEPRRVRKRRHQKQSLMGKSVKVECKEDAEGGSTTAIKADDDQKVHNNGDAEAVGPRVPGHDTGATCLAITDDEHSESQLIMMPHSASTMSLAPLSPPITLRDSSVSGLGCRHHGKDDATRQCRSRCCLVRENLREDSQTGMESNYLFDPPLLRWPSPKPVESVQTRQDATDVLFRPFLERSGDSAGACGAITVIIPRVKSEHYIRNNGVITTRNTTHDFQGGRAEAVEALGLKCPDGSN